MEKFPAVHATCNYGRDSVVASRYTIQHLLLSRLLSRDSVNLFCVFGIHVHHTF